MGNNSIFDDLGIGSSDLGFSQDPDEVARENQQKLDAQQAEIDAEKTKVEAEAETRADEARLAGPGSRSRSLLTGGGGAVDGEENVARRTLLGN